MQLNKNGSQITPLYLSTGTYEILQCIIVEELAVNDKITIAASDMSSFAGRRIYCSVVKL